MSAINKTIVQEVNDAFNESNLDGFLKHCTDGVFWTIVGKEPIVGKEAIAAFMGKMPVTASMKITTRNIIGDGDLVACDGEMESLSDDDTGYKGAFCDFYRFEGDKIAELNSYVVDFK